MEHTPGPWFAQTSFDNSITVKKGTLIAQCDWGSENNYDPKKFFELNKANALLMAASPDLFDACEAAYSYLKSAGKESSLLGLQLSETLKKAKGQ